ncbi:MAG: hypothetical protein KF683_20960 [Rubrivivax sp.]|nr:hypothetical protein [Rubrivivax sp.]
MNIFRTTLLSLATIVIASLAAGPALADTMSWRLATVISTQQGGETVRRGVAIMSTGQPALVTLRLRPTAPPAQGAMPFTTETEYRFDDGSSFVVRGQGIARMSPEGVPITGETRIEGSFVAGTGRYAGIAGTVRVRTVSGLNPTADGILGDQFAEAQAEYTLNR